MTGIPAGPGGLVPLPEHRPCFVCGSDEAPGVGLHFAWDPGRKRVVATFEVGVHLQGPPGHAHGGSMGSVLDEAMGAAVWIAGHRVLAVHLEFDYRRPVPLGAEVTVEAWSGKRDGRRVHAESVVLLATGKVAVEGRGVFCEAPGFFERAADPAARRPFVPPGMTPGSA